MLSYRHAFHAGNHADVLKHFVLCEVLGYMNRKDSPYWYIDTHAGAGFYDLRSRHGDGNAEYRQGIGRLWERNDLPPVLAGFVATVRRTMRGSRLDSYPGSPVLAESLLREADRMLLFEMHPGDLQPLRSRFRALGRRVRVHGDDGFQGLIGVLPPPTRRAVVLIDPPYEVKHDYRQVVDTLGAALRRFAQGTYLVWYPLLRRRDNKALPERLKRLGPAAWLQVELQVCDTRGEGPGMYGSGLFVVNPPWTLPQTLDESLPVLRDLLALDKGAVTRLHHHIP